MLMVLSFYFTYNANTISPKDTFYSSSEAHMYKVSHWCSDLCLEIIKLFQMTPGHIYKIFAILLERY